MQLIEVKQNMLKGKQNENVSHMAGHLTIL